MLATGYELMTKIPPSLREQLSRAGKLGNRRMREKLIASDPQALSKIARKGWATRLAKAKAAEKESQTGQDAPAQTPQQ